MVDAVTTPTYQITVNDNDITSAIASVLISLNITDNEKDTVDELQLTVSKKYQRPAFGDAIKVYLGHGELKQLAGLFYVQKTNVRNNQTLIITGTGVDFGSGIKERRQARYEHISPVDLASTIAAKYGLQLRATVMQSMLTVEQNNESDLNLLSRLAKEHGWVFNIKNRTLYLTHREIDPPAVAVDIASCSESDITHSSTKLYKSCQVIYQDTKQNKNITIEVGSGQPTLIKRMHCNSETEARQIANSALQRANQDTAEGSLVMAGQLVFAGSLLQVDGGSYTITTVSHTLDNKGWKSSLQFNNSSQVNLK